jgi:PHD/YefM family antitoxin component YafN of YafNO toxin-antitoxin module
MNAFEICGMVVSNFSLNDIQTLDNVERGLFVQSMFSYLEIACMLELPPRLCENLQRFTTGSDTDDLKLLSILVEGKSSFDDFVRDHGLCVEYEQEPVPVENNHAQYDNAYYDYPSDYDSEEEREDRRECLQEKKEERNRRKYTTTIISNGRW